MKDVILLGGYDITFTNRDIETYKTIISGNGINSVITCNNIPGTAKIDGFTIKDGGGGNGGGIYCSSSFLTISNNTITGNTATHGYGGIYCYLSSPTISNNTITGNTASYGGGIYCSSSSPTISNCIITSNNGSYGIYCSSDSSNPQIKYTDIWGHLPNQFYDGTTGRDTYPADWDGTGCISANPFFVYAWNGNFHLQNTSPCIDTGDPAYLPIGGINLLDGSWETQEGIADTAPLDMGYHYKRQ